MKSFKLLLPMLAMIFAVSIAWTTRPSNLEPDYVWFEVDAFGNALDTESGVRGDTSPFGCSSGTIPCARALSLSDGEVSPNTTDSEYHINSGFDTQNDYNAEETKP